MTTTITSQTDNNKKYFLTISDETGQATDCSCGDRTFRHRQCKHMTGYAAALEKAITFASLMRQYDIRSQAVREAKRAAYIEDFQIYG